jgi:trehalose 6-phosphate synthase
VDGAANISQIVLVSNRGPFSFSFVDGEPLVRRGAGGLVTAIGGVARAHDVLWISCALGRGDAQWLAQVGGGVQTVEGMRIRLTVPDPAQYRGYYSVISNPLLWFVQHQLQDAPRFPMIDQATWQAWSHGYAGVNRQLAATVADSLEGVPGRVVVLVQDYHLYLLPRYLRELLGERVYIHFFSHIPWPGPDSWTVLPSRMRLELLTALLHADRLGFQTERDTRRFLQTCVANLPEIRVTRPWRQIVHRGRAIAAAPYPISVDVAALEQQLARPEVRELAARVRRMRGDRRLILRVDRVEPSKNILRGLIAYRHLLTAYPAYRGQVLLLCLLVPSRSEVAQYRDYLRDVTALTGEINATLGDGDWEPVRLLLGHHYLRALAALSESDVLLVNPLADGMNLVAKEGAVLNRRDGVLILSEEAGAAEELGAHALLVSPFDVHGTGEALRQALDMPPEERHARAVGLAEQVRDHDIHGWFARQLADIARDLDPAVGDEGDADHAGVGQPAP